MPRKNIEDFEEDFEEVFAEETETDDIEIRLEDDEISPEEEGFIRGAKDASDY